jgi:hypothetical protein
VDEIAFGNRYREARERGDHEGYARLLAEHPEFVANREGMRVILHMHARDGETGFVRALLDAGVDVNLTEDDQSLNRAIAGAVLAGSAEMVRLLLDRGSDVNWATSEHPIECCPLPTAIRGGRLDIVQMLVEAGALLNVIGPAGHTPLSWAIAYRRPEIAEYLRCKGALLPHETPGWTPPPPPPPLDPIVEAMWELGVKVSDQPIAEQGAVAVYLGTGPNDPDRTVFFTKGMSQRALNVPQGGEAYQYAELAQHICLWSSLPCEIEELDQLDWASCWMIDWMFRIARLPFKQGTWLEGKWTIISNEDPPQPLSEYTAMTCWLLLGEKEPLARAELPDGKSVCFYTMMPIHTAERDLALRQGIVALLRLFEQHEVLLRLDPNRPSLVELNIE